VKVLLGAATPNYRVHDGSRIRTLLLRGDFLREAPVLNKLSFGVSSSHDVL
jgi:hypothetical protein